VTQRWIAVLSFALDDAVQGDGAESLSLMDERGNCHCHGARTEENFSNICRLKFKPATERLLIAVDDIS
jgi:hypothetical protein